MILVWIIIGFLTLLFCGWIFITIGLGLYLGVLIGSIEKPEWRGHIPIVDDFADLVE